MPTRQGISDALFVMVLTLFHFIRRIRRFVHDQTHSRVIVDKPLPLNLLSCLLVLSAADIIRSPIVISDYIHMVYGMIGISWQSWFSMSTGNISFDLSVFRSVPPSVWSTVSVRNWTDMVWKLISSMAYIVVLHLGLFDVRLIHY